MTGSTVSVIVPCYNHAPFIVEAVESVLRQGHSDLEVIIVDDCSTDNSWEVIQRLTLTDPRVKAIRHSRNQGLPSSRNDGLSIAAGEYIAFCDSDDVWEPNKLETQLASLSANPQYDVVYCDTRIIDQDGVPTGKKFSDVYPPATNTSGWMFDQLVHRNFINVQSALMRRRCLESTGSFDEDLGALEDWWYWVQLSRSHQFLYLPDLLARYRVHSQSMSAMRKRCFPVSRIKIYKRMLARYHDMPIWTVGRIRYTMGVDLIGLGKFRTGRGCLCEAISISSKHFGGAATALKAAVRLILSSTRSGKVTGGLPTGVR